MHLTAFKHTQWFVLELLQHTFINVKRTCMLTSHMEAGVHARNVQDFKRTGHSAAVSSFEPSNWVMQSGRGPLPASYCPAMIVQ